ncbi:TrbM/KikA/MpfK family conjugal transfer protein [Thauera mechernichensis]|uniref:TrbM/KikA/MpfK family conjugal transfer protein n=1 Tax=Thauera mechernichensis TaxID=82788 RepID=A0ABW3WKH0_9RHOO|nr:TrbM/KikA/MpfK family conjugal transfer protein [Thauera mechernichensis]MDG3066903.1 TrbM/KikA/MpfK family conjugal transfer protein [Thauera mechernichensis]
MKLRRLVLTATLGAAITAPAMAQEVLEGDTRLACEAILCLATGKPPHECQPSLQKYFSITAKKLSDTIKKRRNFLDLCPVANQTPEMSALVNAMSQGAGRCDASSLNATLRSWGGGDNDYVYIANSMPSYCAAYTNHAYTDLQDTKPRYVGIPERGGYWVEADKYDQALAEYNERIRREDEERRRQEMYGGGA